MFYSAYNITASPDDRRPVFICVEADNFDEAKERLLWFGIDMETEVDEEGDRCWEWYLYSCDMPLPSWGSRHFKDAGFSQGSVILFRSGHLWCSSATPLGQPHLGDL